MKRLINVRIPLFCALGLILGIVSCKELLCGDFYFGLILMVLLVVGLVVALVLKRAVKVVAFLLCFALVGFAVARLSYRLAEGNEVVERDVVLQGRVCDLGRNSEDVGYTYYLENCVDASSGDRFRGRVEISYFNNGDEPLNVGDVVTLRGMLHSTYPIKTSVNSFAVRNRIYYELIDCKLENRTDGKLKFDEKVRRYVYGVAMNFAPQNGGIVYALLTGDRNAIDSEILQDFTRAGTIHLLAVSGLHVGFVVALICFALKKLQLKPLVEGAIILVPLLFYAYVCGFSPSVTRAVTMTVCVYLSRVVLGRYDLLTSLSISAIIALFLTPYSLFDAGFQLSFLSVFGILTIYTPVMRLFAKRKIIKFFRYLLSSLFLSLSCSLATLFALAANFGQVPLLGVFVNLVAIPLITVTFVLSIFAMIPWVFHYLLFPADKVLFALVWLNKQVSNLSFATVSFAALAISAAVACVLMFVVGGFVNLDKIAKRISCIACAVLLVATVVVAMVPRRAQQRVFVSYGFRDTVIAATSTDGSAAIVGDFSDKSATLSAVQFLGKYRLDSCTLFVCDFGAATESAVEQAVHNLPVARVYVFTQQANDGVCQWLQGQGVSITYLLPNSTVQGGVTVRSIFNGGLAAVNVSVGEIDVCLDVGNGLKSALQLFGGADLYVLKNGVSAAEYSQSGAVTFTLYQTNLRYNYGANKYGNFTIRQKDGRIVFNFS